MFFQTKTETDLLRSQDFAADVKKAAETDDLVALSSKLIEIETQDPVDESLARGAAESEAVDHATKHGPSEFYEWNRSDPQNPEAFFFPAAEKYFKAHAKKAHEVFGIKRDLSGHLPSFGAVLQIRLEIVAAELRTRYMLEGEYPDGLLELVAKRAEFSHQIGRTNAKLRKLQLEYAPDFVDEVAHLRKNVTELEAERRKLRDGFRAYGVETNFAPISSEKLLAKKAHTERVLAIQKEAERRSVAIEDVVKNEAFVDSDGTFIFRGPVSPEHREGFRQAIAARKRKP